MMKAPAMLPLLLVALVVLTSGCSVPGLDGFFPGPQVKEYENDILIIKSIQAVPDTVAPGQQVRVITYVQNVGDDLIPQTDLEKISGKDSNGVDNKQILVELYDYCEGLFTITSINCPGKAVERSTKGGSTKESTACEISKILPGQILEVDWVIEPKSDIKLETHCPVDGMKVRVRYPYKTSSLSTITVMRAEEMQRQIEEGTFKRTDSYIVAGQGPVKPFLYVEDQQPISQASKSTVLALQVENRGSGFLSDYSVPIKQDHIKIMLPIGFDYSAFQSECNFVPAGGKDENDRTANYINDDEGLRLIYGKSPKLLCKVAIPDRNIAKEITFTSMVDIEYLYEFRDSVAVTVEPKM